MRRKFLLTAGVFLAVWLSVFGFRYFAVEQGCWFPILSFSNSSGYVCTDRPQSPIPKEDLAVLTPTPAELVEFAAAQAIGTTIVLTIYAGLAGIVTFGVTKAFRKLWDRS